MENVSSLKKEMRQIIKERWKTIGADEKKALDEKVYTNLISMEEYKKAKVVFAFVGTETEVDTVPIIKKILSDGKELLVPRCTGKGLMNSYKLESLNELEEGKYGILEPKEFCPLVEKEKIDFAIVPSVSCDRALRRLGHGGGYYDRYMENQSFTKVLVSYEKLLLDEIPTDKYDIICDYLVTEEKIYKR